MVFLRRDRSGSGRFLLWRVGLFFLAAGLWIGGVLAGNRIATGAAILVLLAAVALGAAGRGRRRE